MSIGDIAIGRPPVASSVQTVTKRIPLGNNAAGSINLPGWSAQSLDIYNNTPYWAFFKWDSTFSSDVNAVRIMLEQNIFVPPFTFATVPASGMTIGYYFAQNRHDLTINVATPNYVCQVTFSSFPKPSGLWAVPTPTAYQYGTTGKQAIVASSGRVPITGALVRPLFTMGIEFWNMGTTDLLLEISGDGNFAASHTPPSGYADFSSTQVQIPSGGYWSEPIALDVGWRAQLANVSTTVAGAYQLTCYGYN